MSESERDESCLSCGKSRGFFWHEPSQHCGIFYGCAKTEGHTPRDHHAFVPSKVHNRSHDAIVTLGKPCGHCGGCEWVCAVAAQEDLAQIRDAVLALLERKETGR